MSHQPALAALAPPDREDHRVVLGREKRRKMHARLLEAMAASCLQSQRITLPLVDEVVVAAGVSRGTFYKYFESIEEAAIALAQQLGVQFTAESESIRDEHARGIRRLTTGSLALLLRAYADPPWGLVLHKVDTHCLDSRISEPLKKDLHDARVEGDLTFGSMDAAIDLTSATMLEGIGRLGRRHPDGMAYIFDICTMVLKGLGASPKLTRTVLDWTWEDMQKKGPIHLPWWRDFT